MKERLQQDRKTQLSETGSCQQACLPSCPRSLNDRGNDTKMQWHNWSDSTTSQNCASVLRLTDCGPHKTPRPKRQRTAEKTWRSISDPLSPGENGSRERRLVPVLESDLLVPQQPSKPTFGWAVGGEVWANQQHNNVLFHTWWRHELYAQEILGDGGTSHE